jgi:hypothetical protein
MEKGSHYDCMDKIGVGLIRDFALGKTGVTVELLR